MKQLTFLIVVFVFLFSFVEAQSVCLGIGGGFSTMNPTRNYAFMYRNDGMSWPGKFEETAGQKSDIGFNIASSLEVRLPSLPISLTGGLSYTQLYGRCDFVKGYSPPWYGTMYTSGELRTRSNILTMKTGVQWEIIPSPIAAYASLDLLYNLIGDTRLSINNSYGATDAIIEGNTRMGLSFGAGVRVALLPSIDTIIGANYSLINLVTPDSREEAKNTFSITASFLYGFL